MRNRQFINGKWIESTASQVFDQRNPANLDEITGQWPQGGREDARAAIEAAQAAFPAWRALQRRGMEADFGWGKSVESYGGLYRRALERKRALLP